VNCREAIIVTTFLYKTFYDFNGIELMIYSKISYNDLSQNRLLDYVDCLCLYNNVELYRRINMIDLYYRCIGMIDTSVSITKYIIREYVRLLNDDQL